MNKYTHFKRKVDDAESAWDSTIYWTLDGKPVADGETLEVVFPDGTTSSFTADVESDTSARTGRFSCGLEINLNGYNVVVPVSEVLKARRA